MGLCYRTQRYWQLLKSHAAFHGYIPSPLAKHYSQKVYSPTAGNKIIAERIREGRPFCAGKIGHNERAIMKTFLDEFTNGIPFDESAFKRKGRYLAGIYPDTRKIFYEFFKEYSKALAKFDMLAIMGREDEPEIIEKYSDGPQLVDNIRALEPYYFKDPWSQALENKKILVITGFPLTVSKQFANRKKVWPTRNVLNDFELETLAIPQNAGVVDPVYENWAVALKAIEKQIEEREFDIALIGAGAWSLPLCAKAKEMGKAAIHTGGATQILFGIRGGRWNNHPVISQFYNDYWTSILDEEMPNKESINTVPKADQYW